MDDILGGAHTEAEAKQLILDLTKLLPSASFELRKWTSNNAKLLSDISRDHLEKPRVYDNADGLSYIKIIDAQTDYGTMFVTLAQRGPGAANDLFLTTMMKTSGTNSLKYFPGQEGS
ncbi:hypothetical protein EVAR_55764_1 [Eumeta japonica]|uniref:Uncharacterized protein n=1 Tax=Eumeta variegata TaxID=151549 RepID=A0A4C1XE44_EUMVA|nr:hypothetical protein EVAR_55764_1 [Eumeta japonica]